MSLSNRALTAIITVCGFLSLYTSCTDHDDNIQEQVKINPVPHKEYINDSIQPGDDFYMYCLGTWWDNTELAQGENRTGFVDEMQDHFDSLAQYVDDENITKLKGHLEDFFTNTESDQRIVNDAIERVRSAQTKQDLWNLMGTLIKEGFQMPVRIWSLAIQGTTSICFIPACHHDVSSSITESAQSDGITQNTLSRNGLLPFPTRNVEPIVGSNTKAVSYRKWPMLIDICHSLDIDPAGCYVLTEQDTIIAIDIFHVSTARKLEELQELSKEALTDTIISYLKDNLLLCDRDYQEQVLAQSGKTLSSDAVYQDIKESYLTYHMSYLFAQKYCTPDIKVKGQEYVDELMESFAERVNANDWLTDASKASSIEKLNAMTSHIAYPEWIPQYLIDLSQTRSILEDLIQIRKKHAEMMFDMAGTPANLYSFQSFLTMLPIQSVNAYNDPYANAIDILPVWFMEPIMKQELTDAQRYAIFCVLGHEITHGFDDFGIRFDKTGKRTDIIILNQDSLEFNRRAQMLSDYHSTIQVLPGIYANGNHTTTEDIADLGGTEMAFQALTKTLKKKGYSGEALKQEQRNFFIAYANLWRLKYNDEYIRTRVKNDIHSLPRERVNCVVANMDIWYELFDIKPHNKLYRSPSERIHIW